MLSPLPEIREGDAPHEIEVIYADIRHSMRLPLVNLIYRHFATIPGVLPHAWGWVREMAISGALEEALDRLNRSLQVPQLEPFKLASVAYLSDVNRAAIKRTLEAYNRGNGLNLIALTAIKMDLHKQAHGTLKISRAASEDRVLPLPRLLKFSELKPDIADLVATISHLHGSTSGVIPSLYLHLANWPEFLSIACSRIAPLLKDGSIERARRDVVDLAGVEAKGLLAALPRTAKVAGYSDQVVATLDQFTNYVIPEMLPVGLALDRAWPKQFDRALC